MGMFNPLRLAYLTGMLWLLGCYSPVQEPPQRLSHAHAAEAPVVCPTFPEVSAHWVVMLLWDRSGSVQQLAHDQTGRIRTDAMALIERLPPARAPLHCATRLRHDSAGAHYRHPTRPHPGTCRTYGRMGSHGSRFGNHAALPSQPPAAHRLQ